MAVHKAVHPLQVTVGTSGHRYHVSAPCRDKGGCIQLSFGDDTFRGAFDAVDVVGNQFRSGEHFEVFMERGTELDVYQPSLFQIVEAETGFFKSALGHVLHRRGDVQLFRRVCTDVAFVRQPFQLHRSERGFVGRFLGMLGGSGAVRGCWPGACPVSFGGEVHQRISCLSSAMLSASVVCHSAPSAVMAFVES